MLITNPWGRFPQLQERLQVFSKGFNWVQRVGEFPVVHQLLLADEVAQAGDPVPTDIQGPPCIVTQSFNQLPNSVKPAFGCGSRFRVFSAKANQLSH